MSDLALTLMDDLSEAVSALAARPLRTLSTAMAFALGIASALALLITADAAQHHVSRRFDLLRATEVRVTATRAADGRLFPADSPSALRGLAGVSSVGVANRLSDAQVQLSSRDTHRDSPSVAVYGGDVSLLDAAGCDTDGAPSLLASTSGRVAVIGQQLSVDLQGAVAGRSLLLNGVPFTVVGVTSNCRREALFESAVVISENVQEMFGPPNPASSFVLVVTVPGAAAVIATQVPLALSPADPHRLATSAVPDPRHFRRQIESDTRSIVLSAAALACMIGLLTMANAGSLRVLEQRSDLGLRRSLGATSARITRQVLIESAVVGFLSSVGGATVGVSISLGICIVNGWTPSINPAWAIVAPVVGTIAGCLAGIAPARRAVISEPMAALLV